jgi:hypothetical protein
MIAGLSERQAGRVGQPAPRSIPRFGLHPARTWDSPQEGVFPSKTLVVADEIWLRIDASARAGSAALHGKRLPDAPPQA